MKENRFCLFLLMIFCAFFWSCNQELSSDSADFPSHSKTNVSVVAWNLETFFDAESEGTEYSEFLKNSLWTSEKYTARLSKLCEVLTTLNPDIFVMEEIENKEIIYDISNQLAGLSWNSKNFWNYGCFYRENNSSIGCAVISKYPLFDVKTHSIDIQTQKTSQPSVRPILEVTANVNGQELVIFVNHWKSKSGGAQSSEIWRDWQESCLANCMNESFFEHPGAAFIACGDFNRDATEFSSYNSATAAASEYKSQMGYANAPNRQLKAAKLRDLNLCTEAGIPVYSPWFTAGGKFTTETGSYFYQGEWNRIDHFFSMGNVKLSAFAPKVQGAWAGEDGIPKSYSVYTGEGYSDHLPIMCTLTL